VDARTRLRSRFPFLLVLLTSASLGAQQPPPAEPAPSAPPTAVLLRALPITLPGKVDSNSPAIWTLDEGIPRLHVVTSVDGQPSLSAGRRLGQLMSATPVNFVTHPGHGVWMEAILEDAQGGWYGFYHNEIPAELCGRPERVIPRIGAARSLDRGQTWQDLGIVLEAPPDWHRCDSANGYFVGGVGDLSAVLDADGMYAYLFFSQYSRVQSAQGVAVARMTWADRDAPVGRVDVWNDGVWLPPGADVVRSHAGSGEEGEVNVTWRHSPGTALFPTTQPWHDDDPANDAFWGASVHWNAYLEQYVMLLNRVSDEAWTQEGIYVSFSPTLEDPTQWSAPQRLLTGGDWYPQVIGIERGAGTDKHAGQLARFFMSGSSAYLIEFQR
jgi:hypothetical protein